MEVIAPPFRYSDLSADLLLLSSDAGWKAYPSPAGTGLIASGLWKVSNVVRPCIVGHLS